MQLRLPLFGDSSSSGLLKPTTLSEEVRELAFTPEELEAMRLADEEIEREFRLTNEDLVMARETDKASVFERKDAAAQKVAAQKKAWYEANREKINEKRRRKYREKHSADQAGV